MPKGYRTYLPEQELLLPPSLREWLPENHLAYVVSDVVDQLDLSATHAGYEKEKRRQLKEEVTQLLEKAEAADREEDHRNGGQRGDELPEELRRRETRLAKIKQAKKVVEQRARDKAAEEGKSAGEVKRAKPDDKDQYNFTDPESRIMKGADGFGQGYNAQAAVEPTWLLIVGQSVTEAANDKQQLIPMVELIEPQSRQAPEPILADNREC